VVILSTNIKTLAHQNLINQIRKPEFQ
jgi:hypothetical protein